MHLQRGSRRNERSVAPSGGFCEKTAGFLGLTPQAKHLSRLRRSSQQLVSGSPTTWTKTATVIDDTTGDPVYVFPVAQ